MFRVGDFRATEVGPDFVKTQRSSYLIRGKNDTCMKTLGWNRKKKKHETHPETNRSHLKIGRDPKGNQNSNHPFAGAMLVSGMVNICNMEFHARVFGRVRKLALLQFVQEAEEEELYQLGDGISIPVDLRISF